MTDTVKLHLGALYSMAACSRAGENQRVVMNFDSYDPVRGTIIFAVKMAKHAAPQRRKDAHENGWAYYAVGPSGIVAPLSEEELTAGEVPGAVC